MRRFRPYLHYLKMVRGPLATAILCGVLYGVSSGAGLPALVKYVFPAIFSHKADGMSLGTVALIASCIPLVFLVRAVSGYLNSYYIQLSGVRILEALRLDYFRKLQVLPLSFLQRKASGDLLSRGMADTQQLQYTLTLLANDGVKQPMTLAGAIGFLVWQAFTADGVLLVLVCLVIVPLSVSRCVTSAGRCSGAPTSSKPISARSPASSARISPPHARCAPSGSNNARPTALPPAPTPWSPRR